MFWTFCEVAEWLCLGSAVCLCPVCHSVTTAPQQGGRGCGEQPVSHREGTEILSEGSGCCTGGTGLLIHELRPGSAVEPFQGL